MIIGRVPFSPEKVRELESDAEEPATDIPDEYACFNPLDGKPFHYYAPTRLMAPTLPLEESVKETYRKYMALAAENKIVRCIRIAGHSFPPHQTRVLGCGPNIPARGNYRPLKLIYQDVRRRLVHSV